MRVRARFRVRSKKEGERTWRRRAAIALGVTAAVALGVAVYASTRETTDGPARATNDIVAILVRTEAGTTNAFVKCCGIHLECVVRWRGFTC